MATIDGCATATHAVLQVAGQETISWLYCHLSVILDIRVAKQNSDNESIF